VTGQPIQYVATESTGESLHLEDGKTKISEITEIQPHIFTVLSFKTGSISTELLLNTLFNANLSFICPGI